MFKLKKILEVSVLAGLKQKESFKRFGLSIPKGVLLYRPPGCAKTTIAKCLATAANMTFIATSDSLVGRRGLGRSSNAGDVQLRILSTLLTEMDGIIPATCENAHIIVVAATNRPDMVDDALMRPPL
ncbi:Spermatogenesis-associated protein 5 [Eumeta japonica]|uniref:Spermatogenesis-associated protein 5 n=1 Tax=Eumeta variegata TaxID=151549 RepID=A0A4C1SWC1_EUMVA|nr:Spermatogenesis-associated protein 5 [Eumeta japonica]